MKYDLCTDTKQLAEMVVDVLDRAFVYDSSDRTRAYQFWDLKEGELRGIKSLVFDLPNRFTVYNSQGEEPIWPSKQGFTIDQVLDF